MSNKVKLDHCYPLPKNLTAAAEPLPELPPMPADFPAELLDPEQLEAVQAWWADWQQDSLAQLRHILTARPSAEMKSSSPPNLRDLSLRCILLCHLLSLHPAAERSLATLAAELQQSDRHLSALKSTMLRALSRTRRQQEAALPNTQQATLAAAYPLLDFSRLEGKRPVIVVPFRQRLTYCTQFELCEAIASHPGISATLTLTAAGEDALRITFHSGLHHPARRKRNTNRNTPNT